MNTIRDNALAALAALDRIKLQVARILTRERTCIENQAERIRTGARATRAAGSLVDRHSLVRAATSSSVRGRSGSILRRDMVDLMDRSPPNLARSRGYGNRRGK